MSERPRRTFSGSISANGVGRRPNYRACRPWSPGQPDPNAAITRIVVLPDGSIAVAYNESSYASGCSTGQILHRDVSSGTWSRLNGPGTGLDLLPIFGLDVDPWGVLYAATDNHVFVAAGIGQAWQDVVDRTAASGSTWATYGSFDTRTAASRLFAGNLGPFGLEGNMVHPRPPGTPGRARV